MYKDKLKFFTLEDLEFYKYELKVIEEDIQKPNVDINGYINDCISKSTKETIIKGYRLILDLYNVYNKYNDVKTYIETTYKGYIKTLEYIVYFYYEITELNYNILDDDIIEFKLYKIFFYNNMFYEILDNIIKDNQLRKYFIYNLIKRDIIKNNPYTMSLIYRNTMGYYREAKGDIMNDRIKIYNHLIDNTFN